MRFTKRATDIVLGTILAIACLPLMIAAAIVSAVTLRCWPMFVQHRVGKGGRLFRMVKVRTLPIHAPKYASKYELDGVQVPAAMAWLRRLHLDELPQLLLVPFGKMSLVGPRPEMEVLTSEFDRFTADLRTSVRPGCTGLWQVSPRSTSLIPESPEFDEFYLAHQSLRLDLWVLWRTFCLMALGRSPATLESVPSWVLRRRSAPMVTERSRAVLDTSA